MPDTTCITQANNLSSTLVRKNTGVLDTEWILHFTKKMAYTYKILVEVWSSDSTTPMPLLRFRKICEFELSYCVLNSGENTSVKVYEAAFEYGVVRSTYTYREKILLNKETEALRLQTSSSFHWANRYSKYQHSKLIEKIYMSSKQPRTTLWLTVVA